MNLLNKTSLFYSIKHPYPCLWTNYTVCYLYKKQCAVLCADTKRLACHISCKCCFTHVQTRLCPIAFFLCHFLPLWWILMSFSTINRLSDIIHHSVSFMLADWYVAFIVQNMCGWLDYKSLPPSFPSQVYVKNKREQVGKQKEIWYEV